MQLNSLDGVLHPILESVVDEVAEADGQEECNVFHGEKRLDKWWVGVVRGVLASSR